MSAFSKTIIFNRVALIKSKVVSVEATELNTTADEMKRIDQTSHMPTNSSIVENNQP